MGKYVWSKKKERDVYHNINHKIIHKQNKLKELYQYSKMFDNKRMSKKQELLLTFSASLHYMFYKFPKMILNDFIITKNYDFVEKNIPAILLHILHILVQVFYLFILNLPK